MGTDDADDAVWEIRGTMEDDSDDASAGGLSVIAKRLSMM